MIKELKYYWLDIYLSVFVVGNCAFYLEGLVDHKIWDIVFFIWQSLSEGSFFGFISLYAVGGMRTKSRVYWLIWFCVLRFIGEFICAYKGWDIDNQWFVALFFLILIIIAGYLMLKKASKGDKFFSKHLFKS